MKKIAAILLSLCLPAYGQSTLSGYNMHFNTNIVFNTASWNNAQTWLSVDGQSLTGTLGTLPGNAGGFAAPVQFYIGNDTVDTTTNGVGGLTILGILDGAGSGFTGNRQGILGEVAVVGTPGNAAVNVVGGQFTSRCNANMTGATGAYTNYSGGCFGGGSFGWAQAAATFIQILNSWEFDTAAYTGSSVAEKHGITIVKTGSDAVQGAFDDSALEFNDQDTTTTAWKYGISFGAYAHKWPFSSSSTLIVAQLRQSGSPATAVALNGIDFTQITFSGSPMLMPLLTPASSGATCTTGAIEWDTGFIYICTATNTWKRATLNTF